MMTKLMKRLRNCVEAHLSTFKNSGLQEYAVLSKVTRHNKELQIDVRKCWRIIIRYIIVLFQKPREVSSELLDLLEDNLGQQV